MAKGDKISTDGGSGLGQNPFGALGGLEGLPSGPNKTASARQSAPANSSKRDQPNTNRGRVEIRRLTGGKGGKTVTSISGFTGIAELEKGQLARRMQKVCGCGGTVKAGVIELQGDKRDQAAGILREAGFRPVMAGG